MYAILPRKHHYGFTLIELLVVISIIAILSVVGFVAFQNVTKNTKDAKIKADLNAIKKAYEANFDPTLNGGQGGYKPLSPTSDDNSPYFTGGKIPTQPNGSPYTYAYGPDAASPKTDGYKVSATLSGGTPTSVISTQGTLTGTGSGNILSTCDPSGALASNLVNYYQMEAITGETTADSKGGTAATVVNVTTSPGIVGNAASFNGSSAYIKATPSSPSSFTVSMWIKSSGNGFSFLWEGGGVSSPSIEGSDTNYQFYMSNQTNPLNTGSITQDPWYLITATYDAGSKTKSLYVNDQSKGSNTNADSNSLNPFYIGARGTPVYFYSGLIDEVAIFDLALSGSEISKIYNSGQGCSII